jgi:hypothetical protein
MKSMIEFDGYSINAAHITQMWINGPWRFPTSWKQRWQMSGGSGVIPSLIYVKIPQTGLWQPIELPKQQGDKFKYWTGRKLFCRQKYVDFNWVRAEEVENLPSWFLHVELAGRGGQIEQGTLKQMQDRRQELVDLINSLQMECKYGQK